MSIIDIFYCRLQNGKTWTLRTDLGISFQESKIFCYDDCNYDNYLIHNHNYNRLHWHYICYFRYSNLRLVPAYNKFIQERFERCLDLYLCPRQRKMRVNSQNHLSSRFDKRAWLYMYTHLLPLLSMLFVEWIVFLCLKVRVNPDDLLPKLPRPRDLQPFPTTESIVSKSMLDLLDIWIFNIFSFFQLYGWLFCSWLIDLLSNWLDEWVCTHTIMYLSDWLFDSLIFYWLLPSNQSFIHSFMDLFIDWLIHHSLIYSFFFFFNSIFHTFIY